MPTGSSARHRISSSAAGADDRAEPGVATGVELDVATGVESGVASADAVGVFSADAIAIGDADLLSAAGAEQPRTIMVATTSVVTRRIRRTLLVRV